MSTVLMVVLGVATYAALVNLTPVRIGARVGFWASAAVAVRWSLDATDDD